MDADPPGSADTFTVLLDLTSTTARFDIGAFQMLGKTLKLGFRGRLHRLYIYPVGRLERLAFAALKAVMGKGTPQKARWGRRAAPAPGCRLSPPGASAAAPPTRSFRAAPPSLPFHSFNVMPFPAPIFRFSRRL